MQDKRAVVQLVPEAFGAWLRGSIEEASAVLVIPQADALEAAPEDAGPSTPA